jgi:LacI family transcriptional regulator
MDLMNGIGRSVFETKYSMNQYFTRENLEDETLKDILHTRRADAVINISFRPDIQVLEEFRKAGRPIVLVEDVVDGFAGVKVDNFKGAYMATEHLLKKGRKHIGILTGRAADGKGGLNVLERIEGYKKALDDYDIDLRKRFMTETVCYSFEEGKEAFDNFMENKKGIDAIFCAAGDITAMGIIKRAQERGVKIPGDLAIVGYDDVVMSSVVSPSLTTVKQPVFEMGQAAVKMTVDQMEREGRHANEVVIFQPELVVRESA